MGCVGVRARRGGLCAERDRVRYSVFEFRLLKECLVGCCVSGCDLQVAEKQTEDVHIFSWLAFNGWELTLQNLWYHANQAHLVLESQRSTDGRCRGAGQRGRQISVDLR